MYLSAESTNNNINRSLEKWIQALFGNKQVFKTPVEAEQADVVKTIRDQKLWMGCMDVTKFLPLWKNDDNLGIDFGRTAKKCYVAHRN